MMKDDERQINRWKKIVNRFRGKLVKVVRDAGTKFDDYSVSPKIRQILLHWGYALKVKDFFDELTNQRIKMSYYWFHRQKTLQKAKERYSKEKAAEGYVKKQRRYKRKVKRTL